MWSFFKSILIGSFIVTAMSSVPLAAFVECIGNTPSTPTETYTHVNNANPNEMNLLTQSDTTDKNNVAFQETCVLKHLFNGNTQVTRIGDAIAPSVNGTSDQVWPIFTRSSGSLIYSVQLKFRFAGNTESLGYYLGSSVASTGKSLADSFMPLDPITGINTAFCNSICTSQPSASFTIPAGEKFRWGLKTTDSTGQTDYFSSNNADNPGGTDQMVSFGLGTLTDGVFNEFLISWDDRCFTAGLCNDPAVSDGDYNDFGMIVSWTDPPADPAAPEPSTYLTLGGGLMLATLYRLRGLAQQKKEC